MEYDCQIYYTTSQKILMKEVIMNSERLKIYMKNFRTSSGPSLHTQWCQEVWIKISIYCRMKKTLCTLKIERYLT